MNNESTTLKTTLIWIAVGAAARLLPHPANVTPLTAMALLGGVYLPRKQALWLPLLPLLLSDVVLGFHSTMPFVYGSFIISAMMGQALKNDRGTFRVMGACLASSILFFVVTNFGTWLTQHLYSRDAAGLIACYTAAIPFFRNTILGDLMFTAVLFNLESVSLDWAGRRAPAAA